MSTKLVTAAIPASGKIQLGPGNFFFLITATATISVIFAKEGTEFGAEGIQAGYVKGKLSPWERAEIRGTAGVTVSYFFGTEDLREDVTDFRQQIATIAGIVSMAESAAAAHASVDKTAIPAATTVDIAANLLRRRITICNWSDSAGSFSVRQTNNTNDGGIELQAGQFLEIRNTAAIRLRTPAGTGANYSTFEET